MSSVTYKFAVAASGAGDITTTLSQLAGYSFRESATTAAAATVLLRKTNASGDVVVAIELGANGSETNFVGGVIDFGGVIFIDRVAGTTEGSIWGF